SSRFRAGLAGGPDPDAAVRRRAFYPEPSGPFLVGRHVFRGLLVTTVVAALTFGVTGHHASGKRSAQPVEVIVRLAPAPLSQHGTALSIDRAQRTFDQAIARRIPAAHLRWRYRIVL